MFQPAKSKPEREKALELNAVALDALCGLIEPEPRFASKVTVLLVGVLAVHWANKVVLTVKGKLAPSACGVPLPIIDVFHPEKVKPVLVKALVDNAVALDAV